MTPINLALTGYGYGAKVFHLPFWRADERFRLVKIHSRSASEPPPGFPGTELVRDFDALLTPEIDAIVITTPNPSHAELTRRALQAGKHVVVEKPLCARRAEGEALYALAAAKNRLLAVYHNRRWDSGPLTLAALLATGRLGTPVDVFLRLERYAAGLNAKRWKETGEPGVGLLYDLGPHLFDMALRLFGRPQQLAADVRRQHPGAVSDDNFTVNLYYANGLKIVLGASKYAREPAPFLVCHGTAASYVKAQPDNQEGLLAAGVMPRGDWNRERPCDWGLLHDEHGRQPIASVPGHYGAFYANFYEALRGRAPLAVQKAEVLAVLELLELSGASAEQGRRLPV